MEQAARQCSGSKVDDLHLDVRRLCSARLSASFGCGSGVLIEPGALVRLGPGFVGKALPECLVTGRAVGFAFVVRHEDVRRVTTAKAGVIVLVKVTDHAICPSTTLKPSTIASLSDPAVLFSTMIVRLPLALPSEETR